MKAKLLPYATFIKFCIVGGLGTLIDFLGFFFGLRVLFLPLWAATILGFVLAVINNFLLNKFWTFRQGRSGMRKQMIKFTLVSLGGLVISVLAVYLLVYTIEGTEGFLEYWRDGLIPDSTAAIAKLTASAIVLMWNFLLNKHWTFRQWSRPEPLPVGAGIALSIIIPAYNEENRIGETLGKISTYCSHLDRESEIIVVDDGSPDHTIQVVNDAAARDKRIRLVTYGGNRGKGYAVKSGVLEARGEIILFTDADNATPIEEYDKLAPFLRDHEVVIGSRYAEGSNVVIQQPAFRVRISRMANYLIQFLLLDGITDTQCGFKAFRADAAKRIFSRMKTERFGFDMELLCIARMLGYAIAEVPVNWFDSADSRVRPFRDTLHTLYELFYIKLNIIGGRYE